MANESCTNSYEDVRNKRILDNERRLEATKFNKNVRPSPRATTRFEDIDEENLFEEESSNRPNKSDRNLWQKTNAPNMLRDNDDEAMRDSHDHRKLKDDFWNGVKCHLGRRAHDIQEYVNFR